MENDRKCICKWIAQPIEVRHGDEDMEILPEPPPYTVGKIEYVRRMEHFIEPRCEVHQGLLMVSAVEAQGPLTLSSEYPGGVTTELEARMLIANFMARYPKLLEMVESLKTQVYEEGTARYQRHLAEGANAIVHTRKMGKTRVRDLVENFEMKVDRGGGVQNTEVPGPQVPGYGGVPEHWDMSSYKGVEVYETPRGSDGGLIFRFAGEEEVLIPVADIQAAGVGLDLGKYPHRWLGLVGTEIGDRARAAELRDRWTKAQPDLLVWKTIEGCGDPFSWIVKFHREDSYFWRIDGDGPGKGHCTECHHQCSGFCSGSAALDRFGPCMAPGCGHTAGCPGC